MAALSALRTRLQRLSIRDKLLALVLLPLAVVLPLLGLILLWWSSVAFDRVLVTKVRADLAVAQGYFERMLAQVGSSTGAVAESHALRRAMDSPERMAPLLQRYREREDLDFLVLRSADALALEAPPGTVAAPLREHTSVELLQLPTLQRLSPALAERVPVRLVATRNATPTERSVEDRAMVLLATRAVRDGEGRVLAWVQGGMLLNRNLGFIDHVNQIVYPAGSLPVGSQGTATLFLDDVRISTNVRLFGSESEERAIGTRVSRKVREAVLGEGRTWLDRAFVVNEWYVSGYEPLLDGAGQRVGMLYVGFLEEPFVWLKYGALAAIGLVFFAVMTGAALLSLRWARGIFRPLEQMEATMARVEAGELRARVGAVGSQDEIGRLAAHLDLLLDAVGEKTAELQRWNAELDAKVEARTQELREAQSQLLRSEKMAAVGQLTAGIAHEVNNPIAVMQGNLDLMRELLGPAAAAVSTELRMVDQQIERIRLIVTRLLQFARPTDYAGYVEAVHPAEVLEDCLVLVAHLLDRAQIEVVRRFEATRTAAINRQELQQVFVNLLVNALQAMPQGGTLMLMTRDVGADKVEAEVADTGHGLPAELLEAAFQPFVTRKKEGTGLGLWISRSLVERYGGEIRAANRVPPPGAAFTVRLCCEVDDASALH